MEPPDLVPARLGLHPTGLFPHFPYFTHQQTAPNPRKSCLLVSGERGVLKDKTDSKKAEISFWATCYRMEEMGYLMYLPSIPPHVFAKAASTLVTHFSSSGRLRWSGCAQVKMSLVKLDTSLKLWQGYRHLHHRSHSRDALRPPQSSLPSTHPPHAATCTPVRERQDPENRFCRVRPLRFVM